MFENLPDDGAEFRCQRRTDQAPDHICGKPATKAITFETWAKLEGVVPFRLRAICPEHMEEVREWLQA